MARLSFRQGIVRHQTDTIGNPTFLQKVGLYVNLLVSPDPTIITFVHGTTNYLFTDNVTINNAWGPFPPGPDVWLYWDLNRVTGVRTFGHTIFEPIEAAAAPTSPATGQMWFNTAFNMWYEWNGVAWVEVIRVFAAKYANSTALVSMSINSPKFTGTQVGLTTDITVGSLMYDGEGNPIVNSKKQFFTTEDVFTTGVPTGASLKVNNVILRAQAQQPIGAYNVVVYSNFNKIIPAFPFTVLNRVYGITEEGANVDDVVNVVTEGIIFNENWDWPANGANVNDPVYIDNTGQIVLSPVASDELPIGAVIGPQSILFDPTLYGITTIGGGGGGGTSDHSALTNLNNDDHLQYFDITRGDARYYPQTTADAIFAPVIHSHVKADISDFAHTHTEADITDLKSYLELSGGTMTGILNLYANPTNPMEAATKAYVDALVNGILWRDPIDDPNLAGFDINDPGTITGLGMSPDDRIFIIGATPISLWSAFPPGTIVTWNGTSWVSWDGANGTVQIGDRFGVAIHPDAFPPDVDVSIVSETGKLITITDNTPGSITFDVHTPTEPEAVFVNNKNSTHFAHTYSFTGTYGSGTYGTDYTWIEIVSPAAIIGGTNITIGAGNIIDVSPQGIGSGLDADLWDGQQTGISNLLNKQILQFRSGADIWINNFLDTITDDTETVSVVTDNDNVRATSSAMGAIQLHTSDFVGINHLIGNTTAVGVRFFDGGTNPNFHVDIRAADTLTGPVSLTLPTTQPSTNSVIFSDPTGQLDWKSSTCLTDSNADTFVGVGGTTGTPCADSGTDDVIISAANIVDISATTEVKFNSSVVKLDSTGSAPSLLFNTDATNFISLKAPGVIATDYTLTLPIDTGTVGQALITDGNGITSWSTISGGGTQTCLIDGDGDTYIGVSGTAGIPCTDINSGDIFIQSGSSTIGNVPAGDIFITTGKGDIFNDPGDIFITAEDATDRRGGEITILAKTPAYNAVVGQVQGGTIKLATQELYHPITIEVGAGADGGGAPTILPSWVNFTATRNVGNTKTPEFRFCDVTDPVMNWIGVKSPDVVATSYTLTLPPTEGLAGQVLTADGFGITTFKYMPYDIMFTRLGTITDADIIQRFVAPRYISINESSNGTHNGYCDVAPTSSAAVFTVYTASQSTPDTFVSRGTITFAIGSRTATIISLPSFDIFNGDHVIIQATTAGGIQGPHIMLAGFSVS